MGVIGPVVLTVGAPGPADWCRGCGALPGIGI